MITMHNTRYVNHAVRALLMPCNALVAVTAESKFVSLTLTYCVSLRSWRNAKRMAAQLPRIFLGKVTLFH